MMFCDTVAFVVMMRLAVTSTSFGSWKGRVVLQQLDFIGRFVFEKGFGVAREGPSLMGIDAEEANCWNDFLERKWKTD